MSRIGRDSERGETAPLSAAHFGAQEGCSLLTIWSASRSRADPAGAVLCWEQNLLSEQSRSIFEFCGLCKLQCSGSWCMGYSLSDPTTRLAAFQYRGMSRMQATSIIPGKAPCPMRCKVQSVLMCAPAFTALSLPLTSQWLVMLVHV